MSASAALHPLAARSRRRCLVRSVKGSISETAATIKRRLWEGGCGRGADMSTGKRKVISRRAHADAFVATRDAAPALGRLILDGACDAGR